MRRNPLLAAILAVGVSTPWTSAAQHSDFATDQNTPLEKQHHKRSPRPNTFEQVDSIRNIMALDRKQFEKLYSAYEKYNKAVFGADSPGPDNGQRPPRREGMGGHGGPGGHGGMGGPRGGGQRGGFQGGDFDAQKGRVPRHIDPAKLEETKAKQEEKLSKEVKKLFKNEPAKYDRWMEIRTRQLADMFKPMVHANDHDMNDGKQ